MEDNSSQINLAPPKKGVNRLWMILILIAIFAIVGLTAAIIIVNLTNKPEITEQDIEQMSIDEANNYYQKAIDNATTPEAKAEIRTDYAEYLVFHEQTESGLEQLQAVDETLLTLESKSNLYYTYALYYSLQGSEEKSKEYNEKLLKLSSENNVDEGGG